MVFNRKRKDNRSPSFILDDSPKRTKVQAQRKFAQGSNVNSPVLTPVKEIEMQEKVIPEPIELIPMKRPNTEDFLTFLCFRGTPVLPSNLNFFNNAAMIDTRTHSSESSTTSPKNGVILPSNISKTQGERPFIAFGVRKRADPIVVSRHMDKKRRHALALQALRRKYQEQKMAKIRAITISKLSEKVQTNKTVVRTTRSITKSGVTKKNINQKTKITVVATKRVKVTTSRTNMKPPLRKNLKQKMCLRSYRGRFVQKELMNKPTKKRVIEEKVVTDEKEGSSESEDVDEEKEDKEEEEEEEEEEEFSSDDDEPLMKQVESKHPKIIRKTVPKKVSDIRLTRTRSNILNSRRAANKRLLVHAQNVLKSSPTSPRLRARLQKLKLIKTKTDIPIKRKVITKKVEIKTKTTGIKPDQLKKVEKKGLAKMRELRKPLQKIEVKKKSAEVVIKRKEGDLRKSPAKKIVEEKIIVNKKKNNKEDDHKNIEEKRSIRDSTKKKTEEHNKKAKPKLQLKSALLKKEAEKKPIGIIKKIKPKVEKTFPEPSKVLKQTRKNMLKKSDEPIKKNVPTQDKLKKQKETEVQKKTKINEKNKNPEPSESTEKITDNKINTPKQNIEAKIVKSDMKVNCKKKKPQEKKLEQEILETIDITSNNEVEVKKNVAKEREKMNSDSTNVGSKITENEKKDIKKSDQNNISEKKSTNKILDFMKEDVRAEHTVTELSKLKCDDSKLILKSPVKVLSPESISFIKVEGNINKEHASTSKSIAQVCNLKPQLEQMAKKIITLVPAIESSNLKITEKEHNSANAEIKVVEIEGVRIEEIIRLNVMLDKSPKKSDTTIELKDLKCEPVLFTKVEEEKKVKALKVPDVKEVIKQIAEIDLKVNTGNELKINTEKELKVITRTDVKRDSTENGGIKNSSEFSNRELSGLEHKKKEISIKTTPVKKTMPAVGMNSIGTQHIIESNIVEPEKVDLSRNDIILETGKRNANNKNQICSQESQKIEIQTQNIIAKIKQNDKPQTNLKNVGTPVQSTTEKLKMLPALNNDGNKEIKPICEEKALKPEVVKKVAKTKIDKPKLVEEEIKIARRPSRKTKEAATLFMEILGHKLVNEEDIDDNSIDSFPELPNVRRTELREIELKAQAKMKETEVEAEDKNIDESKKRKSKSVSSSDSEQVLKPKRKETKRSKKAKTDSDSDESFTAEITIPVEKLCRQTRNRSPKLYKSFSDTDSEADYVPVKKAPKRKSENVTDTETKTKPEKGKRVKNIYKESEDSFSESDEEPLVKFTQKKNESKVKKKVEEVIVGKQKRECTKRPQNYLPQFSSSDEDEKYFHGFVKCESPPKPKVIKTEPTIDLLVKDVGRRFGKEKVNMSNEQIEKWLNDSALAGMTVIKKENDEMLKFGEKIPTETFLDTNMPINTDALKTLLIVDPKDDKKSLESTPEKGFGPIKPLSNERKTIFRKEKNLPLRNINAFSVCNESSVYAFEADNEDSVSTPFRRPSRRPSSTATSRSEEELLRLEQDPNRSGKFRLPNNIKNETMMKTKDATLSTDESNNSSSLAPVIIEVDTEIPTQTTDNEHLFYIPKGVAMKGSITIQQKIKTSPIKQEKPLASSSPMFPPASICHQKNKSDYKIMHKPCNRSSDRLSETSEDFKYKVPSSPSASSSSSAKLYKRQTKSKSKVENYPAVNVPEFPSLLNPAQIVEGPVFYPNEKEFSDPIEYIEKIRSRAEKFGICRIVPPSNFKPECKVLDEMRFTAYNQYVHKMMHRWGPNFRELVAIRKYLATQSISLKHPPWIGGMEIDLPRLYQTVQTLGGLKEVIEKKKWPRVSELMKIPKSAQDRVTKLDDIYCKYLLPYDTLSPDERDKLFDSVETEWAKRESKNLLKSQQTTDDEKLEIDENESDEEEESDTECIVKGRSMALSAFYRIARNTMSMWFKTPEPMATEVEEEFWKHVTTKQYHLCVHSGSIDSGNWGYGFAVSKNSPFARHAWNLKVLTNNSGSILRSMGPVMGLTVPTLHVGMVFSGCCWYRDPHGLPWIEYLHTGGNKIWYGIPNSMSEKFHSTLLKLVPNYCLNKSIWLPSDTAMLPPNLLIDNGVSLTRTVQEPGQFVVIFPKAFTSNICTGYVVSESVFFAPPDWLNGAENIFEELRNSCEPSMFSYERLLLNIVSDPRSDVAVLNQIIPAVQKLCDREKAERRELKLLGVTTEEKLPLPDIKKKKKMHETEIEYACEDCRWNLFCSMVLEIQENAIYCLEHASEHIKEKELEPDKCKLMYTYDSSELETLIDKVKSAIEMKIQKKAGSKFTGLATLMNR